MQLDTVLLIVAAVGIGAGAFMVARSPVFWFDMWGELWKRLLPFILKRMPPEDEKEWRELNKRAAQKEDFKKFNDTRRKNRD